MLPKWFRRRKDKKESVLTPLDALRTPEPTETTKPLARNLPFRVGPMVPINVEPPIPRWRRIKNWFDKMWERVRKAYRWWKDEGIDASIELFMVGIMYFAALLVIFLVGLLFGGIWWLGVYGLPTNNREQAAATARATSFTRNVLNETPTSVNCDIGIEERSSVCAVRIARNPTELVWLRCANELDTNGCEPVWAQRIHTIAAKLH